MSCFAARRTAPAAPRSRRISATAFLGSYPCPPPPRGRPWASCHTTSAWMRGAGRRCTPPSRRLTACVSALPASAASLTRCPLFLRGYPPQALQLPRHSAKFDLVARMLVMDPDRRITAREALEHPYFIESVRASCEPTPTRAPAFPCVPTRRLHNSPAPGATASTRARLGATPVSGLPRRPAPPPWRLTRPLRVRQATRRRVLPRGPWPNPGSGRGGRKGEVIPPSPTPGASTCNLFTVSGVNGMARQRGGAPGCPRLPPVDLSSSRLGMAPSSSSSSSSLESLTQSSTLSRRMPCRGADSSAADPLDGPGVVSPSEGWPCACRSATRGRRLLPGRPCRTTEAGDTVSARGVAPTWEAPPVCSISGFTWMVEVDRSRRLHAESFFHSEEMPGRVEELGSSTPLPLLTRELDGGLLFRNDGLRLHSSTAHSCSGRGEDGRAPWEGGGGAVGRLASADARCRASWRCRTQPRRRGPAPPSQRWPGTRPRSSAAATGGLRTSRRRGRSHRWQSAAAGT